MNDTPSRTLSLVGPAADRSDDPEILAIGDFLLVSLEHQPGLLVAKVRAPESPGEVEDYHDSTDYLERVGFA
jgi:hypothetical protein